MARCELGCGCRRHEATGRPPGSGVTPVEARFWPYVDRQGWDDCWLWTGCSVKAVGMPDDVRYGRFGLRSGELECEKNGPRLAHRIAFRLVRGHWPSPVALHGCDVTLCCNAENPAHLHEGTPAQNAEERRQRGRGAVGERIGLSKVSDAQAQEMYDRYQQGGIDQRALAAEFGITQPSVSYIVRGRRRSLQ
jgi:hypothetical protein